ncbi:MAG TPA: hypothetical protein VMI54_28985 [Polyangiaceae bacterium]|nr:hypothetical protein [Polyangiaceae bacterium]
MRRRAVSEFPNDNPELHDGLVWTCPELRGRALPTLRMRPLAGALPRVLGPSWRLEPERVTDETTDAVAPNLVDTEPHGAETEPYVADTEPYVAEVAAPSEPPPAVVPAAPATPFERFVATVAGIALHRGATRAALALTALLTEGRLGQNGVDSALLTELARRNILAAGTGHASPDFAAATSAWRAVLDGTGGDLSGCGSATLDAWAAELLAAVTNAPRAELGELKRELRLSGVAAFGLLAVA